jgi:hypothetical protein
MLVTGMTVTSGDEVAVGVVREIVVGESVVVAEAVVGESVVVPEAVVVRGARLVQAILSVGNFLNLRRIQGPWLTGCTDWLTGSVGWLTGSVGWLTGSAGRLTGSPGPGVTGARWPWRSPGRARPRHAIHASERNRCNA